MKNAVIILEPLNHMYGVLIAAAKRNFEILTIGRNTPKAVKPYEEANSLITESVLINDWYDRAELNIILDNLSSRYNISGTYACAEVTLLAEADIRERFYLPTSGYEIISRNLNKLTVRQILCEHGLSKLKYFTQDEMDSINGWPFARDAYFKPIFGAGSTKVWCISDLKAYDHCKIRWADVSDIHHLHLIEYMQRNYSFFVEEAALGELFSVECIVHDGTPEVLGITSRSVLDRDPAIEMALSFPFEHKYSEEIHKKVVSFHKALGVIHGPTHTEIMVDADGNVELVEMNLRFAGYDMLYVISEAYNQNIADTLVDISLGIKPKFNPKISSYVSLLCVMPPLHATEFESIEYPDEVVFSRVFKASGQKLLSTSNQIDQVGSCIIKSDSYENLLVASKRVRSEIKVNGKIINFDPNGIVRLN